jgi:hypothetical protein
MSGEQRDPRPGMASVPGPARIECFALEHNPCTIVPASADRAWMDAYSSRHPYRCLPLSIANASGWFVLCPVPLEIEWDGGTETDALTVRGLKPLPDGRPLEHFTTSNFGHGIVTLHTDYIFRTPPGWDLLASGPLNAPKDNLYALTGIIETDWLPYPFTMNWKMMSPGKARFEEGEPFCFVMPVPKQALLETRLEIHRLDDDPELKRQHEAFRIARSEFVDRIKAGDPDAVRQAWQRYYFTGRHPDGTRVEGHTNKIRLREPVDMRPPKRIPDAVTQADVPTDTAPDPAAPEPEFRLTAHAGVQSAPDLASVAGSLPTTASASLALPRRWQKGSALDWIDPRQSILNVAGRARLHDGLLAPSPATRRITSAAEAADHDFLCIEDFLSAAECERLCACFAAHQDLIDPNETGDRYWSDRILQIEEISRVDQEAERIMLAALARARVQIEAFYRLTAPIYADILQIVRWPVGMAMPPHADRANPDGRPHESAYRDFGAVAYLNDDYEGGDFYFTALDILVKPKRGMFLAFTTGFHHEHAVTKVVAGNLRLTMPTFFTFDPRHANRALYPGIAARAGACD